MAKQKPNRWQGLCEAVRQDDILPTREVGVWTERKLWWWNRYIKITTHAMVGNPQFPGGIVYVDLFAGPGVLTLKGSGTRVPGSPLIAAEAPKQFSKIILCEKDTDIADACESRLKARGHGDRCVVVRGDCNQQIEEICRHIPSRSLTLAFVDPTGLHAKFETVERLAKGRSVDFLILVADGYDIVRNVEVYAKQDRSNLDEFLGDGSNWRDAFANLPNYDSNHICRMFLDEYQTQLKNRLGYSHFGAENLKLPKGTGLYRILFASRHELGMKFWRESTKTDKDGQSVMF